MRAAGCVFLAAIALVLPSTPAAAQSQDCAAIARDLGEQRRLGEFERTRAQLLRGAWYRADALHRGLITGQPDYTLENLTRGITETRGDPYFGTETPRGMMLDIHARTLDGLRDVLAGNELLGILGIERSTFGTVLPVMDQFDAEATEADTAAGRYEWAANSLGESFSYCLQQLAQGALADIQAREAQASTPPAPQGAPPAGMTTLCQLTGGPRQGEIMDMTREYGPAHYIAIGDVCYDNNSDTSIGLGIAQ
jgi:hypothetical protein